MARKMKSFLTPEQSREIAEQLVAKWDAEKKEKKEARKEEREERKENFKAKVNEVKEFSPKEAIREKKFNRYGISGKEDFSQTLERGMIGKYMWLNHIPCPESLKEDCDEYFTHLVKGDFKDVNFFGGDKELRDLERDFYANNFQSPEKEQRLIDFLRWMNIHCRQIAGTPKTSEKLGAKTVRDSWESATGKRNYTRVAAWIATHSFITDSFVCEEYIYNIIPKTTNENVIKCWNKALEDQKDIPTNVQNYFMISNGGCGFQKDYEIRKARKNDNPSDDIPFEENPEEKRINLDSNAQVVFTTTQMNENFKEAVAKDNIVPDLKEAVIIVPPEEKKEFTFGELKNETPAETTINPAEVAMNMAQAAPKQPEMVAYQQPQTPKAIFPSLDPIIMNNQQFEAKYPKLSVFTKYVNDLGLKVQYFNDQQFIKLLDAMIMDKNNEFVRMLMIDPYIIYGDNLRVVTVSPDTNDIRRESFVAISQEELVKKMIKGEFSEADRKKVYAPLPKCLTDFSEKYHFLDLVDMRQLGEKGGMNLKEYSKLVQNINTILNTKNVPLTRWTLTSIESPDNFMLTSEPNLVCAWNSDILREPTTYQAAMNRTWIEYNPAGISNKRGFSLHAA